MEDQPTGSRYCSEERASGHPHRPEGWKMCVCVQSRQRRRRAGGGGSWKRMQNKPSRQMVNTDQRECEEEGGERRAE